MDDAQLRTLQGAVEGYARVLVPGQTPKFVQVRDSRGKLLFTITLPPCLCPPPDHGPSPGSIPLPVLVAGWHVEGQRVSYDGKPVRVSPSRVGLLKLLLDAPDPLPVGDLADAGWEPHRVRTSEGNVRQHVKELNREIRAALPELDFDPVEGTGQGYRLTFR